MNQKIMLDALSNETVPFDVLQTSNPIVYAGTYVAAVGFGAGVAIGTWLVD